MVMVEVAVVFFPFSHFRFTEAVVSGPRLLSESSEEAVYPLGQESGSLPIPVFR